MKHRGILSLEDYLEMRADFARYLTNTGFRFLGEDGKVLPLWKEIQNAVEKHLGPPRGIPLVRPPRMPNVDHDLRQLLGLALGVTACYGVTPSTIPDLLKFLAPMIESVSRRHQRTIAERIEDKRREHLASGRTIAGEY